MAPERSARPGRQECHLARQLEVARGRSACGLPGQSPHWGRFGVGFSTLSRLWQITFVFGTGMAMTRVAICARVSSKGGRQEAENQLGQLRAFSVSQSWTVVQEFVDRLSGKTADRDQFQLMFQAASVRSFDVLLFWSLDRLSRERTVATLNHLQRLNSYGVGYRSYTEQYLDSTGIFKEAVIGILAAVARQERVRLSERTIAGLQRAKAQGRVGGRPRTEHNPRKMAKLEALRRAGASIRGIAGEHSEAASAPCVEAARVPQSIYGYTQSRESCLPPLQKYLSTERGQLPGGTA